MECVSLNATALRGSIITCRDVLIIECSSQVNQSPVETTEIDVHFVHLDGAMKASHRGLTSVYMLSTLSLKDLI